MADRMYASNLIYDVGMHQGEDTDYYLRLGYRVIGFEADPGLAELCRRRFGDALATGRLTIIEGAIMPESAGERITFFRSSSTVWGTTDPAWVDRNIRKGADATRLEVPRVEMREVYGRLGVPHYMKIDIEGGDLYVLQTLAQNTERPDFVSIESDKVSFAAVEAELRVLGQLGYTRFKAVQQDTIPDSVLPTRTLDGQVFLHRFEPCSSGPFGDAISQPWMSADEVLAAYRVIFEMYRIFGDNSGYLDLPEEEQQRLATDWTARTGYRGPLPGWYDTHAAR